jgi:hypothetical protein
MDPDPVPDPTPDPTTFFIDFKDAKKSFFPFIFRLKKCNFLLIFCVNSDECIRIRIQEAQKHADPADPDPQHCRTSFQV